MKKYLFKILTVSLCVCCLILTSCDSLKYPTSTITDKDPDYIYSLNEEINILDMDTEDKVATLKITKIDFLKQEAFPVLYTEYGDIDDADQNDINEINCVNLLRVHYDIDAIDQTIEFSPDNFKVTDSKDCTGFTNSANVQIPYAVPSPYDNTFLVALQNDSSFMNIEFYFEPNDYSHTATIKVETIIDK